MPDVLYRIGEIVRKCGRGGGGDRQSLLKEDIQNVRELTSTYTSFVTSIPGLLLILREHSCCWTKAFIQQLCELTFKTIKRVEEWELLASVCFGRQWNSAPWFRLLCSSFRSEVQFFSPLLGCFCSVFYLTFFGEKTVGQDGKVENPNLTSSFRCIYASAFDFKGTEYQ